VDLPFVERANGRVLKGPPLHTVGLFAGVGGIEVGLERAGHKVQALCEIDDGGVQVLEKHFHGVSLYRDVTSLRSLPRSADLLAAGFPCQDLSQAGRTAGIRGSQSGLVGHVFRLLEKKRVPWVLIENVPFMLQLARGRALGVIVGELERLGYRWAYRVVDSRAFGLPQRRERVFLLASRRGDPRSVLLVDDEGKPEVRKPSRQIAFGFYWTEGTRGLGAAVDAVPTLKGGSAVGIPSPPAIVLPSGRIVTPDIRDAERMQGFDADWTIAARAAHRGDSHRWKLVGNAVTVDVAEWIGFRLRSPQPYDSSTDQPLLPKSRWPRAAWNDGHGRFIADVSSWPRRVGGRPLHQFLKFEPRDLSARAASGFLGRLRASSLTRPNWFEGLLERHIAAARRQ